MTEPARLGNAIRRCALAWEWLCLAVFLGLAGWQLFVPPVTGLSDNNDFPKVFGPAHICQAPFENVNSYFVSSFDAGPKCVWNGGYISSEILFVGLARSLTRPLTGRYHFDLRASAAIHLLVLAIAMTLLLGMTRREPPLRRFLLPPLAILMFTDVAYVAYLNSAFMDNASWVLFLLLAAIAASACTRPPTLWTSTAYTVAGVLLVFSKAQHAQLGIPFAGLAAWFAWRDRDSVRHRTAWSLGSLLLLAAAVVMPTLTLPEYRVVSLFNVIFSRLAPRDRTAVAQLGLDAGYQRWIGTDAFTANSPLIDAGFSATFLSRVSFADVALFYLRHPGTALHEIDRELHDSVHKMRPVYMANYRQADGFPPHSMATRFDFWSNLRTGILTRYPYCLVVLYSLPLLAAAAKTVRRATLFPLALTLSVAGISEFTLSTLADGIDTQRHLFLFHVITDALLLLIVSGFLFPRSDQPLAVPRP